MYRFDYVKLAAVFRKSFQQLKAENVTDIYPAKLTAKLMMEMLAKDNPRFSRGKFIQYINTGT